MSIAWKRARAIEGVLDEEDGIQADVMPNRRDAAVTSRRTAQSMTAGIA